MAVFVGLTGADNIEMFVNIEQITRMARYGDGPTSFTRIDFDHQNAIEVNETPEKIISLGEY